MFNKKSKSKTETTSNAAAAAPAGTSNHIVQGTGFEGSINCQNDIRIDGVLNGKLDCTGRVIIGASGLVTGEVNCQNALIEGKFDGVLKVTELLSIKETADVKGDINTGKLHIQQGAIFNVTSTMGGQVIASFDEDKKAKK